jgi:2-polyprenyl-3-methyl-5-hydroxy-6-metoxy-1,4-benzoquinol methylase
MISSPNPSASEGFLAKRARLRRIATRFDCPAATHFYIIGKIASDPAYAAVLDQFRNSKLPIVDIGCGLGLLAHYLREHGCEAPIHGYDFDARKIDLAQKAAARGRLRDVHFAVGDVGDLPPQASNLVLLDVLHYLEAGPRRELLQLLAERVKNGATVLIRGAVRERSWRYQLTFLQECWTRWSGWIPSPARIEFPTIAEIVAPFEATGRPCEIRPLWGRTPFNSRLVVAKPGQAA